VKTPHVMVIGFGDLARRLLPKLQGLANVTGISRRPDTLPDALTNRLYGDYGVPGSLREAAAMKPDYVVFTPVPSGRNIDGYRAGYAQSARNIGESWLLRHCRRAIFVSSTRVYAEKDGAWVTEDSPLAANDPFVRALLDGEACFRRHAAATIVRPSGLYDGARPTMLTPILDGFESQFGEAYTNRIHRDDAAEALAAVILGDLSGRAIPATLNLNDDEPVTTKDLEAWCFKQLKCEARGVRENRPRNNRRISNIKLRGMGVTLTYPSFRDGYLAALQSQR
jgi:nucleoside-diphosphate-sugar epimerase